MTFLCGPQIWFCLFMFWPITCARQQYALKSASVISKKYFWGRVFCVFFCIALSLIELHLDVNPFSLFLLAKVVHFQARTCVKPELVHIRMIYLIVFLVRCLRQKKCRSINYHSWLKVCELNSASYLTAPGGMVTKRNASYYGIEEWHPVGMCINCLILCTVMLK